MRKKSLVLLLIYSLIFQQCVTANATILNNQTQYDYMSIMEKPRDKEKIELFWNSENESFLTSQEKEQLNALRSKVESGNNLTVEEREILSTLRSEAIRKKLGDINFERYKKLIEKRVKQEKGKLEIELTKEEKREIYNFEKEIRGK